MELAAAERSRKAASVVTGKLPATLVLARKEVLHFIALFFVSMSLYATTAQDACANQEQEEAYGGQDNWPSAEPGLPLVGWAVCGGEAHRGVSSTGEAGALWGEARWRVAHS